MKKHANKALQQTAAAIVVSRSSLFLSAAAAAELWRYVFLPLQLDHPRKNVMAKPE